MLIIDGATVQRLYSMDDAVARVREAFRALGGDQVQQPLRKVLKMPGGRAFAVMPAQVSDPGGTATTAFGVKTITVTPDNPSRGLQVHNGLVLVFDPQTGVPAAAVEAGSLTAIRTAAASAVATDLLAPAGADSLAVLGTGVQARAHIEAMAVVRPVRQVRVWGRHHERAKALAAWAADHLGIEAAAYERIEEATLGAGIVCTTTASTEPLLFLDAVGPGTHINAVGASFPHARELDASLVERASVFVDRRESALNEAGDLLFPMREGRFKAEDIRGEIGELLVGRCTGRTGPDEITVFESLGLAVQDVVSAMRVWERAEAEGAGVKVSLNPAAH
ncbi:ornithine cyclodeaminase family protein [Streptomyces sp. NPDC006602]|uniref:ornithine cyclodeaminase family protein n=1 Tax=Streptomyces sp. NPDC006602 TaxID=3364751 RepID=UPI00369195BE